MGFRGQVVLWGDLGAGAAPGGAWGMVAEGLRLRVSWEGRKRGKTERARGDQARGRERKGQVSRGPPSCISPALQASAAPAHQLRHCLRRRDVPVGVPGPKLQREPPSGFTLPTSRSAELPAAPKGRMMGTVSHSAALRSSPNYLGKPCVLFLQLRVTQSCWGLSSLYAARE